MSGTSLDGLDLALCRFETQGTAFSFSILKAHTEAYSTEWRHALGSAAKNNAETYFKLHAHYGNYMAQQVNAFLAGTDVRPDAIASHGHTVFHQPEHGFSTQLGCGATIAAQTGITTACDFRSLDVVRVRRWYRSVTSICSDTILPA